MSSMVNLSLIPEAFRIADESMLSLLDCSALALNNPKRTRFALVAPMEESGDWRSSSMGPARVVTKLEDADPAIREALQWLLPRRLAWLVFDDPKAGTQISLEDPQGSAYAASTKAARPAKKTRSKSARGPAKKKASSKKKVKK